MLATVACGGGSGSSSNVSTGGGTPVVTAMSLTPTNASVSVGSTQQFSAMAGYSDKSSKDVTTLAAWSSSDTGFATIQSAGQSNPGLATGVAPNPNVNITAAYSGVSAVTTLNVTGSTGTPSSFFIGQINPAIAPGTKLQMFGYAEYSDGSAVWVTSTTHWVSSNPAVAAIQDTGQTSPGLVTAAAAGTVKITASFGGLTQSTNVAVATNAVPIDLMDMTSSSQNYLGFAGGLYEDGSDTVPASHDTAGKTAAAAVQPLNQSGAPSATGAVVFLGIGMSNAKEEFSAFLATAASSSQVNHTTLAMEDGASGAATACYWTVATGQTTICPGAKGVLLDNQYDRVRDTVLAAATGAPSAPAGCGAPPKTPCLTEEQVQVLWIKNANPRPGTANERTLCDTSVSGCVNDIGTEAILYESQLGKIIRAAKMRYPNLQQVFLSTRIYAGYATDGLNPEPYAYEYRFSAQWLLKAQIVQEEGGTQDLIAGDMSYTNGGKPAWTAWGTYLWADGTIARSDGTTWLSSDFQSDGTHPNAQGTTKVVNLLMDFYTGSVYTPWFRP